MKAYIEAQGSLLLVKLLDKRPVRNLGASKRARIKIFSSKSRLRLMRFLARIKSGKVRATFMTLTFRRYPTNAQAKAALQAFLEVVRRRFADASCVWRMEYQKRGSVHFHLLWFNLPYWHWQEILETWKRITRQSVARIDVRLVKSRRGVMSYVSKYIAKVAESGLKTFFIHPPYLHAYRRWRKGRFWGYHNKKGLPLGEKVAGVLQEAKGIKRLANAAWEIIGADNRFGSLSFHLFVDHATEIARRNIEKFGLFLDEWRWTVDTPPTPRSNHHPYTEHFSEAELSPISAKEPIVLYRPRSARRVQPVAKHWTLRSSKTDSASRGFPFFDEYGKVVNSPQYKQELDHAIV